LAQSGQIKADENQSDKPQSKDLNKRVDLMIQKEKEKQIRLERERLAKQINEVTDCTFKPKLNRNAQASSHLPAHERLYV
jgi:hypothetical protein